MVKTNKSSGALAETLRKFALKFPDAVEEIACAGTAVESPVFRVKGKSFLFIGKRDLRLKLQDSLASAARLAAKEPARYEASAMGWIKVNTDLDSPPPLDLLKAWIEESYRASTPKIKKPLKK
ncbi:MAG: MmcQ/YjbR family DNA-binding protein [Planctomycetes bacterium]|nr:MmcQ/YjbR family DNA-binding protein [Planctomycetota bacterium]